MSTHEKLTEGGNINVPGVSTEVKQDTQISQLTEIDNKIGTVNENLDEGNVSTLLSATKAILTEEIIKSALNELRLIRMHLEIINGEVIKIEETGEIL
jgi:hypothetical protein